TCGARRPSPGCPNESATWRVSCGASTLSWARWSAATCLRSAASWRSPTPACATISKSPRLRSTRWWSEPPHIAAAWAPASWAPASEAASGRWQHVEVPAQQAAVAERSAIWYRTRFSRPDYAGRILLRFGGAFLAANVWLNGRLLGSHYGYFAPFGFDLTPYLKPENTLVVCCESPVETDLAAKRHLLGWFADGDPRPYPAGAFFSLPEPYRREAPLALRRPVE